MLRPFTFFFKFLILTAVILILGNWLQWRGRTLSDQVKTSMAHAEKSELLLGARKWADGLTQDARKGLEKQSEDILPSERQKLKALIRELNNSYREN